QALGLRYGTEPEQFRHSKLIIAWGANILGTNVHLWPFIAEARRNGAKLYVIDPNRNRTGAAADRHYFINPGSDMALALAMMHVIVGENLFDADYVARYTAGLDGLRERVKAWTPARAAELPRIAAEQLASLAREYATTRPAAIRLNYGVQRSERGATAVRTIALLPALTGSWKEVGGGLQLSVSQAFQVNRAGLERADLQQKALGREARLVNMSTPAPAHNNLAAPPGKAIAVNTPTPAAIAPNQNAVMRGFHRDDLFTVVLEQFPTDTADVADILLPVTTFLENTDLFLAYGHYYLQLARPALDPPGECRSNVEIFRQLALRMGFDDACFHDTEDAMIRTLVGWGHPFLEGITLDRLEREHSVRLNVAPAGDPYLPFAEGNFGTPDGKCHLDFDALDYVPPIESRHGDATLRAKFPLELISPKNDDSMNSTFGHRDAVARQTATLFLSSIDAAARGIQNDDLVRVFNDRGSCTLTASVDGRVRAGVVSAPSVRWSKRSPGGRGINAVTSERLTDYGGGATFYSCLVEVERIGD